MSIPPALEIGHIDQPLLVFGGPYSNLAATEALLQRAEDLAIPRQRIICTGDVVAYCAEPEQTGRLLMESGIHVVIGNCEEALANQSADCGCGFEPGMLCSALSENWYRYADQQISQATRDWMGELPRAIGFQLGGRQFRVIHGGVDQINRFIFASTDDRIKLQQLDMANADIVIGGHCGVPFGQRLGDRAWLNAGVIGLPANDGTRCGWYLMLTPSGQGIEARWHRLDYDHEESFQSMRAAGLNDYAMSLKSGLWPSMDVLPAVERLQRGQPLDLPPLQIRPTTAGWSPADRSATARPKARWRPRQR